MSDHFDARKMWLWEIYSLSWKSVFIKPKDWIFLQIGLATQFWNTNSSKCVTRYTNVEGPCYFDYQCQYNVNLTCDLRDKLCKCQIANQYWSTTLKKCVAYRNYSQSCDSTYLCNINQVNLTCFALPTCNCPPPSVANTCDCAIDQYFDDVALGFCIFFSFRYIKSFFYLNFLFSNNS